MATAVGTGASTKRNVTAAAREATRLAIDELGTAKPTFGFLFAGPTHDLGIALRIARGASGGADIVGSSTAGELTGSGLQHNGVVVMLVASPRVRRRSEGQLREGSGRSRQSPA